MASSIKGAIRYAVADDLFWAIIKGTVLRVSGVLKAERESIEDERSETKIALERAIESIAPNLVVRNGPFKGLRYPKKKSIGSSLAPKLLGSYEKELHPVIEEICTKQFSEIIDVGCAEGYYAVGLAMRFPAARVYAFDVKDTARSLCKEMAVLNGVENRITIGSFLTPEALANFPFTGPGLILSDCEGFERELLTTTPTSCLSKHYILVEVHDFVDIEISDHIKEHFSKTHRIRSISSLDDIKKARDYHYPELEKYDLATRKLIVGEARPSIMEWIYLSPAHTG